MCAQSSTRAKRRGRFVLYNLIIHLCQNFRYVVSSQLRGLRKYTTKVYIGFGSVIRFGDNDSELKVAFVSAESHDGGILKV